jgi:hypothetical protein
MTEQRVSPGWIRYLEIVTLAVAAFGAAIVLTPLVTDVLFAWMIFGETGTPDGFSEGAADYIRFSQGVMGAVMVGWMLLALWLVRARVARGEPDAWYALTASLLGWFVIDTAFSLVSGYWQNAVLNTVVLAAFAPGLAGTRPPRFRAGGEVAPAPADARAG